MTGPRAVSGGSLLRPLPYRDVLLASFGQRLGAQVLDFFALSLLVGPIGLVGMWLNGGDLTPGAPLLLDLIMMLVVLLFWRSRQTTPGKRVLGLKLIDAATGGQPGLPQLVIRYLGYLLSGLPLGLGCLWMLWDSRRQCWHDKLGRTLVVYDPALVPARRPG